MKTSAHSGTSLIVDHDPSRAIGQETIEGKSFLIDQGRHYELLNPKPLKETGVLQAIGAQFAQQLGIHNPTGKLVAMECIIPLNKTATSLLGRASALGMFNIRDKMYPCFPVDGLSGASWHFTADDNSMDEASRILRSIAAGKPIVGSLIVMGKAERGGLPGVRQAYIRADRLIPAGRGVNWQRYLADIGTAVAQTADVISKLQSVGLLSAR